MENRTYTLSVNKDTICCSTWQDGKWIAATICCEAVTSPIKDIKDCFTALIADHDLTNFCMTGEGQFDPEQEYVGVLNMVREPYADAMLTCTKHCIAEFDRWYGQILNACS